MFSWPDTLADWALPQGATESRVRNAASVVGKVLNSGTLSLFVGTGVSSLVGIPLWKDLNARIAEQAGAFLQKRCPADVWTPNLAARLPASNRAESQPSGCDDVLDGIEGVCSACQSLAETNAADSDKYVGDGMYWQELVRLALYGDRTEYAFEDLFHPELVSLASMFMGESRGVVREVTTFNYDDLLESYLRLHGHNCHVIGPWPHQLTPNRETIFYHPHGYLPLQDKAVQEKPFIVLSKRSYERIRSSGSEHAKQWRQAIARMLCVRLGFFIGISGNDEIMRLYFDEALDFAGQERSKRPLGFAVLMGGGYMKPSDWLKKRVVPLEFPNESAVARFLTQICQAACADAAR